MNNFSYSSLKNNNGWLILSAAADHQVKIILLPKTGKN
jgi:hypothetical protein